MKFNVGKCYLILLKSCIFCENQSSKSYTLLNNVNEICPYFSCFSHILANILYRCLQKFVEWMQFFWKLGRWRLYFILWHKWISTHFFYEIHDNRSAYILLLSIYEVHENQLREDHPFLMDINYIIFMHGHSDVCMENVCAVLYMYLHPMVKFEYVASVFKHIYSISCTAAYIPPQKFSCRDIRIDPRRTEMALAFWVRYKINSNFSLWYIMR